MTAPLLIWLPGVIDQLEHAVADTDVVQAGSVGLGQVVAVCSASVMLCSLATPASRRCPDCDDHARGDHAGRDRAPRRDRGFRLPWSR